MMMMINWNQSEGHRVQRQVLTVFQGTAWQLLDVAVICLEVASLENKALLEPAGSSLFFLDR